MKVPVQRGSYTERQEIPSPPLPSLIFFYASMDKYLWISYLDLQEYQNV